MGHSITVLAMAGGSRPARSHAAAPGRERHADDRDERGRIRDAAEIAEVVVVQRGEGDVGAGDAEQRAEEGDRSGGGAVSERRIPAVAPVAVRVRRSPALSLRISPTLRARMASARTAPAAVAMVLTAVEGVLLALHLDRETGARRERPGVRDLIARQGPWLELQPARRSCCPPRRRRPSSVMKLGCRLAAVGAEEVWPVSISWTFVIAGSSRLAISRMTSPLVATLSSTRKSALGSIAARIDSQVGEHRRRGDIELRCGPWYIAPGRLARSTEGSTRVSPTTNGLACGCTALPSGITVAPSRVRRPVGRLRRADRFARLHPPG